MKVDYIYYIYLLYLEMNTCYDGNYLHEKPLPRCSAE